jgi:hypothetical protein
MITRTGYADQQPEAGASPHQRTAIEAVNHDR